MTENIDIFSLLPDDFYEINLETIRDDTTVNFDVYIQRNKKYILYRESSLPFISKDRERLIENRIKHIYINALDRKKYLNYVEENLVTIVNDPEVTDEKKSSIIYDTSKGLLQDVLNDPRSGESIKRSKNVMHGTLDFVLENKHSMGHLMKVMSFDYYTYTHSVNVSLFSIALAEILKIGSKDDMFKFGLGALLHDIGKSQIPDSILNKKGALSDEDWEIMKKHPEFGAEILREKKDEISEESLIPVLQHHEKHTGNGYPGGLNGNDIHLYGKIVAVSDVFDALTTKRSYKNAIQSFDAFQIMKDFRADYDPDIFKVFVRMMAKEVT